MKLIRYDAALHAIAECKAVDEVKDWSDKAAALQAYGRMAQDKSLEIDAAEIRIRSERRLGELLSAQKSSGEMNRGGRPEKTGSEKVPVSDGEKTGSKNEPVSRPTLADAKIDKKLSSRAQKLAAVPAEQFEAEVGEWRQRVTQEGERVTARLERAGAQAIAKQKFSDDDYETLLAKYNELVENSKELTDLAASAASFRADEQFQEMQVLREKLRAVELSRDRLQRENAELRKQAEYWKKQARKAGVPA